jgi:RNA-directed DNA polymerase
MAKTSLKTTVDWTQINWNKIQRRVYRLQKRIYKASMRGDVIAVRLLQKTLLRSWSAKLLATRRVTQDNQGKKTAGVDGIKNLTPKQRLELTQRLNLTGKSKPTRRVWIPKPGKSEKRPLGIPTMLDRALQALAKLALEPEWEAKFEPNSYGFRPGRSCHDAIQAIFDAIKQKSKYVLDADIAQCFDKINHDKLLQKVNTFPTLNRQLKAWLKSGVMDNGIFEETAYGTPQGGVISPLLANIALHGMEKLIKEYAATLKGRKRENQWALSLIRYADDFVILHESLEVVLKCKELISNWLKEIGLELKPSKTKITHTLNEYEGNKGFDFLGFNIRQYPTGKFHSSKSPNGKTLGFKTLIKPSDESIKNHLKKLKEIITSHKAAPQIALIGKLNPVIRGWCNYYSTVVSKEIFSKCSSQLYLKLKAWAKFRHPAKSWQWISKKYWHSINNNNWMFATKTKEGYHKLIDHDETPIIRQVKVKGNVSPFDGNWVYWSSRMGKKPLVSIKISTLLKKQKGKCTICNQYFTEDSILEIDHIIPKKLGGKDDYRNLQLLHRHCHDKKTASDGSLSPHDKGKSIEERCEVKVSCTVLRGLGAR